MIGCILVRPECPLSSAGSMMVIGRTYKDKVSVKRFHKFIASFVSTAKTIKLQKDKL